MRPSYTVSYGVGRIQAGENDMLWYPGNPRKKNAAILTHAADSPAQYLDSAKFYSPPMAAELAIAGIPCISGTLGGNTFANDTGMARMTQAYNTLVTTGLLAANGKVHLVGISMGNALNVRWAKENPTKVASIVGMIPACNLTELYNTNPGGLRAYIEAAWGVVYPAALPANADLLAHAAVIKAAGIPSRLFYSAVDAYITPSSVIALGAAMGSEVIEADPLGSGHAEVTIAEFGLYNTSSAQYRWRDLANWMKARGS